MNEATILKKLRAIDERKVDQAFALLYREYYPVIQSFVYENSGSDEDAADIFQDALIVFYHKIRDNKFELSCTIKTFIYSICKNLWLKKLTGRKQQLIKNEAFKTIALEDRITDILEDTEHSLIVTNMLKNHGSDCEELLTYFYFDGMKTSEVAQKMGYANEQVTRNKKSRCLKKLRAALMESALLKDFFA